MNALQCENIQQNNMNKVAKNFFNFNKVIKVL